jgi:hypothetical protein
VFLSHSVDFVERVEHPYCGCQVPLHSLLWRVGGIATEANRSTATVIDPISTIWKQKRRDKFNSIFGMFVLYHSYNVVYYFEVWAHSKEWNWIQYLRDSLLIMAYLILSFCFGQQVPG